VTEHWAGRGACRNHDPELWFPIGDGDQAAVKTAVGVCRGCPVRTECLDYAIHRGEPGIWGGTTEGERRHLRRELLASAPPDPDGPSKECTNCGDVRLLTAFSLRRRNSDGYDTQCKDCRNATHAAKQLTEANA
jgi:WhiB family transcriptional regulator, redox-sensing transcriptional regulator